MLLAGCGRKKAAQAKNVPVESSRTATVDSTRMEMELISGLLRGWSWIGDCFSLELRV